MVRMAKSDEDSNGLRFGFLKYCRAEQFSKLISFACSFNLKRPGDTFGCNEAMDLSFRSIEVIFLQTSSFIASIWQNLIK